MALLAAMRLAVSVELVAYYLRDTSHAATAERARCRAIHALYAHVAPADRERACGVVARAAERRIRLFARDPRVGGWVQWAAGLAFALEAKS